MNYVIFHFPDKTIIKTELYPQLNILAHAQIIERSLKSRCGGHNECGTCRVQIISGQVSEPSKEEIKLLSKVKSVDAGGQILHRLSCQCFPEVGEDVVIHVPASPFKDARSSL